MAVNPILTSGAQGLERSLRQLDEAAARIAAHTAPDSVPPKRDAAAADSSAVSSGNSGEQSLEAVASLTLYSRQVQAAAKVVETADATMGFLLDIHA